MDSILRALMILAWAAFAVTLVFLFLIARFYEKKARQRVFSGLFLVLAALFLLAGIGHGVFAVERASDILLFVGGSGAFFLNYYLAATMMRRQP